MTSASWKGECAPSLPDTPTVSAFLSPLQVFSLSPEQPHSAGPFPHNENSYPTCHNYIMNKIKHELNGEIILLETKANFALFVGSLRYCLALVGDQVRATWGVNTGTLCLISWFQFSAQLLLVQHPLNCGVPISQLLEEEKLMVYCLTRISLRLISDVFYRTVNAYLFSSNILPLNLKE